MYSKKFAFHPRQAAAAILVGCAWFGMHAASAQPVVPMTEAATRSGLAQAQAAAQRDLRQFVAQYARAGAQGVLDVADARELAGVRVAYGFAVYTVDPAELLAGRRGMRSLTAPTGQYRFIIMLGERPVGMATVEKVNGRFETVAYGAAVLARDVDASMRVHGNAERSNVRFVRVYQARSDMLEVSGGGGLRYAPLHSARTSLNMAKTSADSLIEEADILQPLRSAVRANMNAPR